MRYFLRHVPSRKKEVKVLRFFTTRCFWFQNVFIWVAVFINKWKIFEICFVFHWSKSLKGSARRFLKTEKILRGYIFAPSVVCCFDENRMSPVVIFCHFWSFVRFCAGTFCAIYYLRSTKRHLSYFSVIFAHFCAISFLCATFLSERAYLLTLFATSTLWQSSKRKQEVGF